MNVIYIIDLYAPVYHDFKFHEDLGLFINI